MAFFEQPQIKTPAQIALMRRAGLVVGETLEVLRNAVRPGMTTRELDAIAEEAIRSRGATPSFLDYQGFPASICVSINEVVVHGIPGEQVIAAGDIVSIDCGAIFEGWHGDSAITVAVGEVSAEVAELLRVTEEAMWRGIAAARPGNRIGDIGHAVESYVRAQPGGERYGVVDEYVGHGIGSEMHQAPDVPNVGRPGRGSKLQRGMALAVEPMVTLGSYDTKVLADKWTVLTRDGSWAAHFEHTTALTSDGLWVTTALDGGRAKLAELGVPFGGR